MMEILFATDGSRGAEVALGLLEQVSSARSPAVSKWSLRIGPIGTISASASRGAAGALGALGGGLLTLLARTLLVMRRSAA